MNNLVSAEPKTLPSTIRYVAHGEGGGPQVLQLAERSVPAPGSRKVLIEVAFAGVNGPDVQQRSGHYPPPPGASAVLGLEVAGRGAARGGEVTQWNIGDEVCALTPAWTSLLRPGTCLACRASTKRTSKPASSSF